MYSSSDPIRVLFLLEHLRVGGAEKIVSELIRSFNPDKISITVCLYREIGKFGAMLRREGYQTVILQKDIFSKHLPDFMFFLKPFLIFAESVIFIIRLALLMKDLNIQVLHSHLFSSNLWGRLSALFMRHIAVITTEHSVVKKSHNLKHTLVYRYLNPLADRIVAVSFAVAESLSREYEVAAGKLCVIPNGINMTPFANKNMLPEKTNNLPLVTHPLIVSVGRLVQVKRFDLLLQAIKICSEQVPKVACWIIGDGPDRASLESLCANLNISRNVIFLGERHDVPQLLQHADVAVNTSEREGMPVSLLEAMSAGLAIVATDIEGNSELIKNNITGILVHSGNVSSIASGILMLLNNPSIAEELGRQARKTAEELYDIKKIAQQWEDLYEEVLLEKGNDINRTIEMHEKR